MVRPQKKKHHQRFPLVFKNTVLSILHEVVAAFCSSLHPKLAESIFISQTRKEGLSPFTSSILSPVFKALVLPAGLSSKTCLIKIPLSSSPFFRRFMTVCPPTMLIPRDTSGSLKISTLRKKIGGSFKSFKQFYLKLQMQSLKQM